MGGLGGAEGGGVGVAGPVEGFGFPVGLSDFGVGGGMTSDPGSASVGSVSKIGAVGFGLGFGATVPGSPDDPPLAAVVWEPAVVGEPPGAFEPPGAWELPGLDPVAPASALAGAAGLGGTTGVRFGSGAAPRIPGIFVKSGGFEPGMPSPNTCFCSVPTCLYCSRRRSASVDKAVGWPVGWGTPETLSEGGCRIL